MLKEKKKNIYSDVGYVYVKFRDEIEFGVIYTHI